MLLKSSECSPEVINFLANKACQCYVALCDWASVKEWQATIHTIKQNSTNPVSINLKTDCNYVQALNCFEDGDLAECGVQLELLPGEDYSSLSNTKDKLGKRNTDSCAYCLLFSLLILHSVTLCKFSPLLNFICLMLEIIMITLFFVSENCSKRHISYRCGLWS